MGKNRGRQKEKNNNPAGGGVGYLPMHLGTLIRDG